MTYIRKLFKQNTFVSASNLLISLCGIFTFPIWTRFFSKSDYGILSLSMTTIIFLGAFSKFGLQHAATRYYCEFDSPDSARPMEAYYSTIFIGLITTGLLLCGGYFLLFYLGLLPGLGIPRELVVFIAAIAFMEAMKGLMNVTLLVEHRALKWSVFAVIARYAQFLLSLVFVVFLGAGLYGYFAGQALALFILLAVLVLPYFMSAKIRPARFSLSFLRESVVYGLPLLGFELSMTFLAIGDRFLISFFLGVGALGLYSAGYNFCTYVLGLIASPLKMTVMPMAFELWKKEGVEKTSEFLGRVLNYYFLFIIPIFFGLNYLGREILSFVASEKYADASSIIFYVSLALIFKGVYFIFGMGMYIKKDTKALFGIIISSAVLNVVLNLLLIPAMGLVGAALSTALSYIFFIAVLIRYSFRTVSVKVDYAGIARYVAASVFMLALISLPGIRELHVLFKILAGFLAYSFLILVIDSRLRRLARVEFGAVLGISAGKESL